MVEVRDYSNEDYAEDTDGFDAMENLEDVSAESLEELPDKPEEIPSNLSTINRPADAMAFFEYYDGATNEGACTVSADMSLSESNIPYLLVRVDGSPAQASFSVTQMCIRDRGIGVVDISHGIAEKPLIAIIHSDGGVGCLRGNHRDFILCAKINDSKSAA